MPIPDTSLQALEQQCTALEQAIRSLKAQQHGIASHLAALQPTDAAELRNCLEAMDKAIANLERSRQFCEARRLEMVADTASIA